jgi:hypothetical protein
MKSAMVKLFVIALAVVLCQAIAFADVVSFSGSTTGTFSAGTPADLSFTGTNFSGITSDTAFPPLGCLIMPCGYALNINFGSVTLSRPASGSDIYDNDNFILHVLFEVPADVNGGTQNFTADLDGKIKKNGVNPDALDIDFSDVPKLITFGPGPGGAGHFDLQIDDISSLGIAGSGPFTAAIKGDITYMTVTGDPTPAVPEPASIVLFGTMLLGVGIWRKSKA